MENFTGITVNGLKFSFGYNQRGNNGKLLLFAERQAAKPDEMQMFLRCNISDEDTNKALDFYHKEFGDKDLENKTMPREIVLGKIKVCFDFTQLKFNGGITVSIRFLLNDITQLKTVLAGFSLSDQDMIKVLEFYQLQLSKENDVSNDKREMMTKKTWVGDLGSKIHHLKPRPVAKVKSASSETVETQPEEVRSSTAHEGWTPASVPTPIPVPYVSPADQLWQMVKANAESADLERFNQNIFHFNLSYNKTDNSLCIESRFGEKLITDSECFFDIDELLYYALSSERPYKFYLPMLLYVIETELSDKSAEGVYDYQFTRRFIRKAQEEQCRFDLDTVIHWHACNHAAYGSGAYYPGVSVLVSNGDPTIRPDRIEKESFSDVINHLINERQFSREQLMVAANILVAQFMHQLENNDYPNKVTRLMNESIDEAREFIL